MKNISISSNKSHALILKVKCPIMKTNTHIFCNDKVLEGDVQTMYHYLIFFFVVEIFQSSNNS